MTEDAHMTQQQKILMGGLAGGLVVLAVIIAAGLLQKTTDCQQCLNDCPDCRPEVKVKPVVIKLRHVGSECVISDKTKDHANKEVDPFHGKIEDDIVVWDIQNNCNHAAWVKVTLFDFVNAGPVTQADQLCPSGGVADNPLMPPDSPEITMTGHEGRIRRVINPNSDDRHCYKYSIRVESPAGSDVFDPEFTIWR